MFKQLKLSLTIETSSPKLLKSFFRHKGRHFSIEFLSYLSKTPLEDYTLCQRIIYVYGSRRSISDSFCFSWIVGASFYLRADGAGNKEENSFKTNLQCLWYYLRVSKIFWKFLCILRVSSLSYSILLASLLNF